MGVICIIFMVDILEEDVYFLDILILCILKLLKFFSIYFLFFVMVEGFIKREVFRFY